MKAKPKTLPAIVTAEKVLRLATEISDEEIEKALHAIATAEGSWGLLWGLENIRRSGADRDLYALKGKVLTFLRTLRNDRNFPLAILMAARMRSDDDERL